MKKGLFALIVMAATAFASSGTIAASSAAPGLTNSISTQDGEPALQKFSVLMHNLVESPPPDCSGPMDPHKISAGLDTEHQIFHLLSGAVLDALNKAPGAPTNPAQAALAPFHRIGDQIAVSWSSDERLRYKLLPVEPLLILELAIWNQETFIAYAPTRGPSSASNRWQIAQSGDIGDAPLRRV